MFKKLKAKILASPPGFSWTMFILFMSFLAIVCTIFQYITPKKYDDVREIIRVTDYLVCGSFFIDFCWRLLSSPKGWVYLVSIGWIDLLASVPHFQFLRLGKLVYVFTVVRDVRSFERLFKFLFASKISITLLFSFLFFCSSIIVAAVSVLYFEKGHSGATITTPGIAVWWAVNLASTCGNTSAIPITVPGRIIGGILIVIGYGLFSMNAGIISSWFMKNMSIIEKASPRIFHKNKTQNSDVKVESSDKNSTKS